MTVKRQYSWPPSWNLDLGNRTLALLNKVASCLEVLEVLEVL